MAAQNLGSSLYEDLMERTLPVSTGPVRSSTEAQTQCAECFCAFICVCRTMNPLQGQFPHSAIIQQQNVSTDQSAERCWKPVQKPLLTRCNRAIPRVPSVYMHLWTVCKQI